jgi:hypothetical protein
LTFGPAELAAGAKAARDHPERVGAGDSDAEN